MHGETRAPYSLSRTGRGSKALESLHAFNYPTFHASLLTNHVSGKPPPASQSPLACQTHDRHQENPRLVPDGLHVWLGDLGMARRERGDKRVEIGLVDHLAAGFTGEALQQCG